MYDKIISITEIVCCTSYRGHCNAQDYQLVWSDEFNKDGCLDESIWNYEQGYARNEELQWYQSDNAWCQGGLLVIEARSEKRKIRYIKQVVMIGALLVNILSAPLLL